MAEIVSLPETDGSHPDAGKIWEWSLVLTARGIRHEVRSPGGGLVLVVAEEDRELAEEELQLYEEENRADPDPVSPAAQRSSGELSFWLLLLIALFYKFVHMGIGGFGYRSVPWVDLGSVNAWMVHKGEWWRLVTGLTLHADPGHLLGNLCVGGIFIVLLSREIGTGPAWFFGLISGVGGNALNVMLRGFPHVSIGGSTSVFGVVGILSGLRILETRQIGFFRRALPLPAGLGLLALLGTGGENTDLGAHLFGFGAGLVIGFSCGLYQFPSRNLSRAWEGIMLAGTMGLVVFSWFAALLFGRVPIG